MLEIFSTVAFIVFLLLAYCLYREIQRQKQPRLPMRYAPTQSLPAKKTHKAYNYTPGTIWLQSKVASSKQPPTPSTPVTYKPDVVTPLKSKAYRMSPADPKAVDRLAEYVRSKFPGKSDQWVWEKVIADMERDRR